MEKKVEDELVNNEVDNLDNISQKSDVDVNVIERNTDFFKSGTEYFNEFLQDKNNENFRRKFFSKLKVNQPSINNRERSNTCPIPQSDSPLFQQNGDQIAMSQSQTNTETNGMAESELHSEIDKIENKNNIKNKTPREDVQRRGENDATV